MRITLLLALSFLALVDLSCKKPPSVQSAIAPPPIITSKTGVKMVVIPPGSFEMGSSSGAANEKPIHRVWVDSFLMDQYEVTQEQFRRLQLPDPSHFKGEQRPVEHMSWFDAIKFCNARSEADDLRPCYIFHEDTNSWTCNFDADGYRLPTEAEWEYACRAGTAGPRFFDRDNEQTLRQFAWFSANSAKATHPVGQLAPNPWGLYDMYGNVAEWCNDRYGPDYSAASLDRNPRGPAEGSLAVIRGGAWDSKPDSCRSPWRAGENPRAHDVCFALDTLGFRCVRKAGK